MAQGPAPRFLSDEALKVGHVRRNPRAAPHVQGGDVWSFAVAEGEGAFPEQLVAERRVVIRLKVDRLYGTALDIDG
ncbi:hypothetical protein [Streptomyces sp. NPDC005538]|uniref:hypothetical protein n=1 Tax=unclassified Streptomyces TaxID=2593676 RepID=UPI0033B238DB